MIRRARVKDAPAVHAVLLAAREDIPLSANFADEKHQNWVRDQCRKQRVWIDERDSNLAGVAVMSITEIFYLATARDYLGQRVASDLVDHVIDVVRRKYNCGVEVRTHDNNVRARDFFLRKGFRKHPVKESHYKGWTVYAFGEVD